MTPLAREAMRISQDIGGATFVGAVAVALHTGEQRQSQDLDFVVAQHITNEELLKIGYTVNPQSGKKFTPRGYKIDIYDRRDLNGINLGHIVETAVAVTVDGNKTTINVISLEGLTVAKFRAARD